MAKKYLDYNGLLYFWQKIKSIIPNFTSDLTNDSGFVTTNDDIEWVDVDVLNGSGDDVWEVINTVTLQEAVREILIDKDSNGNSFRLKKLAIYSPLNVKTSANTQFLVRLNYVSAADPGLSFSSLNDALTTSNHSIWAEFEPFGNMIREALLISTYAVDRVMSPLSGVRLSNYEAYDGSGIHNIVLGTQGALYNEGTFIILGVRA